LWKIVKNLIFCEKFVFLWKIICFCEKFYKNIIFGEKFMNWLVFQENVGNFFIWRIFFKNNVITMIFLKIKCFCEKWWKFLFFVKNVLKCYFLVKNIFWVKNLWKIGEKHKEAFGKERKVGSERWILSWIHDRLRKFTLSRGKKSNRHFYLWKILKNVIWWI
jgi:hypothetical protein